MSPSLTRKDMSGCGALWGCTIGETNKFFFFILSIFHISFFLFLLLYKHVQIEVTPACFLIPRLMAYLLRRKSSLYKFVYLPPAQPYQEAPKARTYPPYTYAQSKYAYRAYENPRYGYRKTNPEQQTTKKTEPPPRPEPAPPPKKEEPAKRTITAGSVIGIAFKVGFAASIVIGALHYIFDII